jgi:phage-related protein
MRKLIILLQAKDMASGVIKGVGGSLGGLGKAATIGMAGAATAAVGAGAAILQLARDAAPLEGVQKAFEGIAESTGKSAEEMLASLKKGSLGMVTGRDLMMTYNEAAQLVGTTFANQLPDAMGYLSKVSAATGQDMGFMLDSLVKGVGRLSPMILDNLGIQVNLTMATEKASEMFGKQADALSKAEIQQGMMAVTLEKLSENTAAMPDIAENASTKFAQMGVKMSDLKDKIGLALLPIVMKAMDAFSGFADKVLPKVMEVVTNVVIPALEGLGPVFERVGQFVGEIGEFIGGLIEKLQYGWAIGDFFRTFEDGSSVLSGFFEILGVGEGTARAVADVINQIVQTFLSVIEIGAQVGQIIWGVIQSLIHLIQWGEAMDVNEFMPAFFQKLPESIKEIVAQVLYTLYDIVGFFQDNLPIAIEMARMFWEQKLYPAMLKIADFVVQRIIPAFLTLVGWLMTQIPIAIQRASEFWQTTLLPILQRVGEFIQTTVIPIIQSIAEWIGSKLPRSTEEASTSAGNFMDKVTTVFNTVKTIVMGVLNEVVPFISEMMGKVVKWVQENWPLIKEAISDTMGTIQTIIETVLGAIKTFWEDHGGKIMDFISNLWTLIKFIISNALDLILGVIRAILQIISGDWEGAWTTIKDTVKEIWGKIVNWLRDYAGPWMIDKIVTIGRKLYEAGKRLFERLWDGLKEKFEEIKKWLTDKLDWIRRQFHFSEPKDPRSPLRGMADAGETFMDTFLEGLKRGMAKVEGEFNKFLFELRGMADIGMAFQALGAGAAQIYKAMLDKSTAEQMIALDDQERRVNIRIRELTARLRANQAPDDIWMRQKLERDLAAASIERLAVERQREAALGRQQVVMEELAALEEQTMRFGFLQQQIQLLQTLNQYGLDAGKVLGGLKLGAGASITDLIQATSRVTEAVIRELDLKLSTLSPLGLGTLFEPPRWIPEEFWEYAGPREITVYGGVTIEHVENLEDFMAALELLE